MNDNPEEKKELADNAKTIIQSINKKVVRYSKKTGKKAYEVIEAVLANEIEKIRLLSQKGLPDDLLMLRALVWKILLGYLPCDSKEWEKTFKKRREEYSIYKTQFTELQKKEVENKTFKNKEVLEIIAKDVNRTHGKFSFFFQPTSKSTHFTPEELKEMYNKRQNCTTKEIGDVYKIYGKETHADVLNRILFIYAMCSPETKYQQGMNEILAPIYYCFSYDKMYLEETEDTIEADTFWCFFKLMKRMTSSFDNSDNKNSIYKAKVLQKLVKIVDPVLMAHFNEVDVKFEMFAGKWFILLFSQEYEIGDILRFWDLIFSSENIYYFVYYAGIAFIQIKREELIKSDMVGIMMAMQNYENVTIDEIVKYIFLIKNKYGEKLDKIINEKTN